MPDQERESSCNNGGGRRHNHQGVTLTWENLGVTVSKGRKVSKSILEGLFGYAQPGELLAIMGPSGSGKSTLLDALAGRLSSNIIQTGDILVNGQRQTLAYGTSAYVTQDESLISTLTVREAVHYSALLQLPDSMSNSEKKARTDATIREMGLSDARNTRIGGGWGVKGLSGGQQRRVSICMEILKKPNLLFLDEPTSGLDSAASYYVMSQIAKLDQLDGFKRTIVASVHQPSTEVFRLFSSLCLLSGGKVVYFGPASSANEFFASNGFPCPAFQNPSDHYLKIINKDFTEDPEQGLGGAVSAEEATSILVKAYRSSESFLQLLTKVSTICDRKEAVLEKDRSHASFRTQCLVLTRRSFVNMYRDVGYYWLRLAVYVALAIGLVTVFYKLGSSYTSIQDRGSLLMFVASFLTFMAIGGFPSFVEDMKVYGKERLNGHYGATAFVIGNTISSTPYLLLISILPGAITCYLSGLRNGLDHFLFFSLTLLACMMVVESLMMAVASLVPNFLMGIITGAGIQGLLILGGGFFRLPHDLSGPFWKYPVYYIAFHKYAYQGLFKNEFEGMTFSDGRGGTVTGEEILRDKWQVEMGLSKWVDMAILFGMAVVYRVLFLVVVKAKEKVGSVGFKLICVSRSNPLESR